MKKIISIIFLLLMLFSCRSDDFGSGNGSGNLVPVTFTVQVRYDSYFGNKQSKNAVVTLVNNSSGDTYTATSGDNGAAVFATVIPGSYKVTVSKTMPAAEFLSAFGYPSPVPEVHFNGVQENVIVNANVTATSIEIKSARLGDLVIKQVYYPGSHATQGASFRDQFIEIYNNSNEVIYADGLFIAQLYGKNNMTVNATSLANGQFDWSKSLGMTAGSSANTDYVYADYVLQVPGSGTQYPIQPGQSLVIAQNGSNHKAPLVDNTGVPVTVLNPSLTVDLSTADFEAYLGDFKLSIGDTVYKYDLQNPAVKDLTIAYWGRTGYWNSNNDFLIDNLGRDSFAIFRMNDFDALPDYADPTVSVVGTNTKFYKQIPVSVIIDGVELQHFNPNSQRPKMLGSAVDASFINTDAAFNSQSVIRKTKTVLPDGRRILEDTNNSANDFVKLSMANPRGFAQ